MCDRFYAPDWSKRRRPSAKEEDRAAWVKPAMVLMSPLSPGPPFAGVQADREASAAMRWCSEPMKLSLLSSGPLFAAGKVVHVKVKSAAMKWSRAWGGVIRGAKCRHWGSLWGVRQEKFVRWRR